MVCATRLRGSLLAIALLPKCSAAVATAAEPIRILAAGSIGAVFPKLIAASGLPSETIGAPILGPARLLHERLLAGEITDLFASADMAGPTTVARTIGHAIVVPFARNRMCLLMPERPGVTASTLLDRIVAPELGSAVSTPGADSGGNTPGRCSSGQTRFNQAPRRCWAARAR